MFSNNIIILFPYVWRLPIGLQCDLCSFESQVSGEKWFIKHPKKKELYSVISERKLKFSSS